MRHNKDDVKKILTSIPDDLAEWLDGYVKRKYHGIRGGKSMAVTEAVRLLREKEGE